MHRPKYDDWSWAKGKLDPGESFPAAAVREALEETGLHVRLGRPLPSSTYAVTSRGRPATKEVRYWAAEVTGGDGALVHEIDEVAWLAAEVAAGRLTRRDDRAQVEALATADRQGALSTWPLAILRHAVARPRSRWPRDDRLRPLDGTGAAQASDLVPVLGAYGIRRLVSSPSTRASDTLAPYAHATGRRLRLRPGLSEEGHEQDPSRARRHVERLLERGTPAVVCSHGSVLPALAATLLARVDPAARSVLEEIREHGMAKGELLLAHVVGTGAGARVVAAERHHPGEQA